ncbi:MAG: 30S ribosomal protein S9 [Chlamydiia bacterium]|nr:30S ribosomal protein S9 [Chlamydiia bacterium]
MSKKLEETVAVGRRKTSVASVRLRKGNGKVTVNGKPFETYFPHPTDQKTALSPLSHYEGECDLVVSIKGGGLKGQAGALRHAIARALVAKVEELRGPLKEAGYLTRDPRMKERKKYGQPGARKKFQFSKR